jgi:multidrug efflux pump subunit AcrA (membrane-fusion protein)
MSRLRFSVGRRRAALIAAGFCLAGLAACVRKPAPPAAEVPVKVKVRRPHRVERPATISASGVVEAVRTAQVAFQVSGLVARVYVEEGAAVQAGQLLAELDARDFEYRVQQAAAQVAAARANLEKAESAVRKQELAQAKVDLDRWEDEYKRYKALYERRSMAPADFRKVEAAYLAAKERHSLAVEGARREDREAARQALAAAEAQERIARKALADSKLTAPIGGLIGMKEIEPGNVVGSGRPVFVILDLDPVKVRVGVPEAEIGKVRPGRRAVVQIPSLGEKEFEGRVETVGVAADPASRTYSVKLSAPNRSLVLRAGMIAEARIWTGATVTATTIPGEAVVRDPQGATMVYVYFPEKRRVFLRRVDVGAVYEREVEITRGLSGEEQVVIAGQPNLIEGALVEAEEVRP